VSGFLSCADAAAKSRMQRVTRVAILVKVLIFISVGSVCDVKKQKRRERNGALPLKALSALYACWASRASEAL
jgi:hypothetical protein